MADFSEKQTIGRISQFCEHKRAFVFRFASYSYRAGAIYKLVKQTFIEQAHKSSFTNLCTACSNALNKKDNVFASGKSAIDRK